MFAFIWRKNRRTPAVHKPQSRFRPRLEALEDRCLLSGGVLDPTFGSGGVVNTTVTGGAGNGVATATYPKEGTANDGKIVAATVAFSGKKNNTPYLEVSRYDLNGTLDTTFGGTGEVMTFQGYARGVAVQPDGKVVVAGWEPHGNFAAVRYNADGSLDTSFGSNGEAIINFGRYVRSYACNVALQADGKIVLAGETYDGTNWDVGLARLNTNGSLDTSFGAGGEVATPLPQSPTGIDYRWNFTNLAIDPNTSASDPNSGKLLVAVQTQGPGAVVRYNTNGTLDTTFGGGAGYVNLTTEDPAVAVQSDDRVVVAGRSPQEVFLARLNADGTFDASFGSGGTVHTPTPPNDNLLADSVALQANGQIVVGGMFATSSGWGLMAARYNTDGSLDTTFGTGGFASSPSGTGQGYAVALEPDGRVVVAGRNGYSGGVELARFLAAGPQIGSFTANPNPVAAGSELTLTAGNITDEIPSAVITQVAFYVQINGSNTLLGYGTQSSTGTWTLTFSTAGMSSGTYTFLAVAEDSYGVLGDPATATDQLT